MFAVQLWKRRYSTALGLCLLAVPAFALEPGRTLTQYVHRIWQNQQGLPAGAIGSIFQTREGYLWLATQSGLSRFDGVQFSPVETIYHDGAPANAWMRGLAQDRDGALWAGSNDSGIFRLSAEGVSRYTTAQGLPSNTVQCVISTQDNAIWVCTDQGLARLPDHADRFQSFRMITGLAGNLPEDTGLSNNNVHAVCEDSAGSVWIGADGATLTVRRAGKFSYIPLNGIRATSAIRALSCIGDQVWIGTDDGLIRLRGSQQKLYTANDGLAANFVFSLAAAADGALWIGTRNGFSRLRGETFESYRPQDGLSQSNALSIFVDREGSLWVGTKRGLNQFVDGRGVPYTVSEGLPSNEAGPVLEDKKGVIWAGTLDAGLAKFDGRKFTALSTRNGLPSNAIFTLLESQDGSILAGTQGGIAVLRNGAVVQTYTTRQGLPANEVRSLFFDASGVLWAGTASGLASLRNGRFVTADVPKEPVVALAADRLGRIVLATESSVRIADGDGFREITQNGSSIRNTNALYVDSEGLLWMGLNGAGLRVLDGTKLTSLQVRDGLFDGEIYGITSDGQDRLWLTCSRGVFSVPRSELKGFAAGEVKKVTSIAYSPTDALRVIEGQSGVQPGLAIMRDGRLWFSTIRGLISLEMNRVEREAPPGSLVIENPIVNGESHPPALVGKMGPGQKNLEFDFASLSYLAPARTRFRYMLEGYDKKWIKAGARRDAFYTNLPPGDYTFRVTTCTTDDTCNEAGASVTFELAPFIYQRIWFWPLIAVVIGALAWLGYKLNIRRLRERYDLIVAERSRIARELHDTLIQGFSGITMEMQALAGRVRSPQERETLEEIIRDAGDCLSETRRSVAGLRAVRLPQALQSALPKSSSQQSLSKQSLSEQSLSKQSPSQNGAAKLPESSPPQSSFTKSLADLVREITETKDVRLKLKLDSGIRPLPAEVEYNLLRIVGEAVTNAVKHSGAKTIEVALAANRDDIQLSVKDDGSGFAAGDNVGPRPGHYGLIGMKERAAQIGARLDLSSQPGGGTSVVVTLPLSSVSHPEKVETVP